MKAPNTSRQLSIGNGILRKCERCGKRPAAVPDPERMGRPIRRICSECHAGGLRAGFLVALSLQQQERRRREHEKGQEPRDSCP
jgi:hypothetical protein